MTIIDKIAEKGSDKELLAQEVIDSPEIIPQLIDRLSDEKGSLKFGCEKILRLISEQKPMLMYPYFDSFVTLLDSKNNFIKWGAIITLSNLVSVDSDNKFEKIFDKYYSPITEENMVAAANIVGNSWKIALARPEWSDKIASEILKSENTKYVHKGEISSECTNVVCGHAIESFDKFYDTIEHKNLVLDFVKRQLNNQRSAVAKKAEKFFKKHRVGS